jgi:hypothetical protein
VCKQLQLQHKQDLVKFPRFRFNKRDFSPDKGKRELDFLYGVYTFSRIHSDFYPNDAGFFCLRVKRPELEADNFPYSTEI